MEEKSALQRELIESTYGVSGITVEQQDFYKVSSYNVEHMKIITRGLKYGLATI